MVQNAAPEIVAEAVRSVMPNAVGSVAAAAGGN
jgi:hypothetical protein